MENEKNFDKNGVYSKRVRAGKRRTYFFDVRTTRANDYYLTITESKKRFEDDNYDRHKIFIYKEDFVKFVNALQDTVNHIKTELLPDYDFDAHSHEEYEDREFKQERISDPLEKPEEEKHEEKSAEDIQTDVIIPGPADPIKQNDADEEVEKWD
ncbi:MAG: DNA-binding protein [Bacteroidota bacterium]|nr:DNA-binding protein [Bacteroidota bacterium]